MEIYDKDFKIPRGAVPTTKEGIERRIRAIYELNKDKINSIYNYKKEIDKQLTLAEGEEWYEEDWPEVYDMFSQNIRNNMNAKIGTLFDFADLKARKINVNEAAARTFNEDFWTGAEVRGRRNIAAAIRGDQDLFAQMRQMSGWHNKYDEHLFEFHTELGERGLWVYAGSVIIDTDNSPKKGAGGQITLRKFK